MKHNITFIKRLQNKPKKQDLLNKAILQAVLSKGHNTGKNIGKTYISISDGTRVIYKDCYGENWYEIEILDNCYNDYTISELEAGFQPYVINSIYDCTGQPFTVWHTFHKNPCGKWSLVHRVGLDL